MAWYHTPGPDQDVAVWTEMRCRRNIASIPFSDALDAGQARGLISDVSARLLPNGFTDVGLSDLPRAAAYALAERQYIRADVITRARPHALLINEPCALSVTVGAEDHIIISAPAPGLALREALAAVASTEALLDNALELAFDERLGYLTADPIHIGTGLSSAVTLCLLCSEAVGDVASLQARMGLYRMELTPLIRQDSGALGGLYRLSMTKTLGHSEEEVVASTMAAARYLIDTERRHRNDLPATMTTVLSDRFRRSHALLSDAVRLDVSEALEHLSNLRVGAAWGLFPDVRVESLTAALMETMPANLFLTHGGETYDEEALRGARIRDMLSTART